MSTDWKTTMKPTFIGELLALPGKELHQVMTKIHALVQDPRPDAKVKIQLKYRGDPRLYCMRCGDYRVFYTFKYPFICLLALRRRQEDTYDEDLDAEFLGGFDPDLPTLEASKTVPRRSVREGEEPFIASTETVQPLLPEPITSELLNNLFIPTQYHAALLAIQSEDDLLYCPNIPEQFLTPLIEYLFPPSLEKVMQEPDLVLQDVDDLLRFKKGELLGFPLEHSSV